jgi:hypothetical protein
LDAPDPQNFGRASPWLLTKPAKESNKIGQKMPKTTLKVPAKIVRLVQKI